MKKYTSEYSKHKYDAIIIGSGLGGLTTAAILAKEGKKVLVLERHFKGGGFTHVFKRKKYEWDIGLHYLGDLNQNEFVSKIFNYISTDPLHWESMGDIYDVAIIEGDKYEFPSGKENLISKLIGYFPEENIAINKYFELIKKLNNSSAWFFSEKTLPPFLSYFFSSSMRKNFLKYANQTTYDVISKLTSNKKLLAVLCTQCGNYGLTPMKSSFAIHAAVALHYMNGGFYPIGGSEEIFNTIAPSIINAGGAILIGAGVKEILVEAGVAKGVIMQDGKIIKCDVVVSGAGIHITLQQLLSESNRAKFKFWDDAMQLAPSYGHLSLYIGLKHTAEEMRLPKANYWIYPNGNDHDKAIKDYLEDYTKEFPVVYISFPASKNPKFLEKYPGRSTIEIITVVKYDWFKKWEDTRWKKRGDEYDAFKELFAQRLLEHLYTYEPQLRGKIDLYELSTPITTKHFCNYLNGEIYGLDHHPERFAKDYLKPQTPIKNFYLTGQDIVTVGIGGALMSGVLTASAITKKDITAEIIKIAKQDATNNEQITV